MRNKQLSKRNQAYKAIAFFLFLFGALPTALGAGGYDSQSWSVDLTPMPPRRPSSLTPLASSPVTAPASASVSAPLPPARPKNLSGSTALSSPVVATPAQALAPLPPRRPKLDQAAGAPLKPQAQLQPKPAAAPAAAPAVEKAAPKVAEPASACETQSRAVKQEFAGKIDKAIASLNDRMKQLKTNSKRLGNNLDTMLAASDCMREDFPTGGIAKWKLNEGLTSQDKDGNTAPQAARLMPDMLDQGFRDRSSGRSYEGLQALVKELEAAKQKWNALDICGLNMCQNSNAAISDIIKPLPTRFAAVKATLDEIQDGLDKANAQADPAKQNELLEYTVKEHCMANGMNAAVQGGINGFKAVKSTFDNLKADVDKYATIFRLNVLAKVNAATCSSMASMK